jgi:enoyl-CoA hydratase/carnithine racemase
VDYQTIDFTVRNKVATIRLNRPDRGNAMNSRMHLELYSLWDLINDDEDI